MSLILEALRKSDAERRLGTAPGLLAPMPVLRPPQPRRRWRFAITGGVAFAVVALVLGWRSQHGFTPSHDLPISGVRPGRRTTDPSVTEDAARLVPKEQAVVDLLPARVARPNTVAVTAVSRAITAPRTEENPLATRSGMRPGARAATFPPLNRPSAASTGGMIAATPSLPAPTSPSASPIAPAPVAAALPDEPILVPIGSLSVAERSALPVLKVSMHVYANDSAQRFMIVDGQRVGEGAQLADGVILVRIRHDGAEIDAHGMRVLLPKP